MSRWAERLKAKYASANSANSADSSPEAPATDLSASNGAIGTGISAETDPGEWRGEYEAPEPAMAVRYWRHAEVRGAPLSALAPRGPLFDAADWLDAQGHGPVAIIEEQR
jgi:hypothetical protein